MDSRLDPPWQGALSSQRSNSVDKENERGMTECHNNCKAGQTQVPFGEHLGPSLSEIVTTVQALNVSTGRLEMF